MDNQHRKIKGYRELSQAEIDLMNVIKEKGVELGDLVERLRGTEADHPRLRGGHYRQAAGSDCAAVAVWRSVPESNGLVAGEPAESARHEPPDTA